MNEARVHSGMNKQRILDQASQDYYPNIVSINEEAVADIAAKATDVVDPALGIQYWYPLGQGWSLEDAALCWAVFAAQAFRFWRLTPTGTKEKLHYGGKTGSNAMLTLIVDCWRRDATASVSFDADAFHKSIQGVPAQQARIAIATELSENWATLRALVVELIHKSHSKPLSVADAGTLATAFPSAFQDPYLKKAQLAVAAIAGLAQSQHPESSQSADLTAMADYQVPRVLRALEILHYSTGLAEKVTHHQLIESGSTEERAIRSATILAVEMISQRSGLPSVIIDNLLWQSQEVAGETRFHLTETTYY